MAKKTKLINNVNGTRNLRSQYFICVDCILREREREREESVCDDETFRVAQNTYLLFSRSHSYSWKSLNAISEGSRVDGGRDRAGWLFSPRLDQRNKYLRALVTARLCLCALFPPTVLSRYPFRSKTRFSVEQNFASPSFEPLHRFERSKSTLGAARE